MTLIGKFVCQLYIRTKDIYLYSERADHELVVVSKEASAVRNA